MGEKGVCTNMQYSGLEMGTSGLMLAIVISATLVHI